MRGMWIKNAVLFLGMAVSATSLMAQQTTAPAQENAASAPARPQLSAEQKKQLSDLRESTRDQAAIIRNDQSLSAEQKQAKLKELRANTREQMKALLTPEQQQAFAARQTAAKSRLATSLGLSADQQGKLKELFTSTHQQRETVLKNATLTNEQKQAQLTQIRQTTQAQLATILTPDQLAKFQQMRKRHSHAKQG